MSDRQKRNVCAYCGGEDGCRFTHGTMDDVPELSVDDWRMIHWFITQVELPFLHSLIIAAQKRKKIPDELRHSLVDAGVGF